MGTKLEEMSQATARLQDELRDAKAIMSAIDLNPLLNSGIYYSKSRYICHRPKKKLLFV